MEIKNTQEYNLNCWPADREPNDDKLYAHCIVTCAMGRVTEGFNVRKVLATGVNIALPIQ